MKKLFARILGIFGVSALPTPIFAQGPGEISNWLPDFGNFKNLELQDLIKNVLLWVLIFAGVVAVIYAIYGGYMYITSAGDAEKATAGRNALINAIIGLIIIFASYAIITWIWGSILLRS